MARKSLGVRASKESKYITRKKNRCLSCSRGRAFYRKFMLCRVCLLSNIRKGNISGFVKY